MKRFWFVYTLLASLAVAGLCLPEAACAAGPTAPAVTDVALAQGGVLQGQVVSPQTGKPMANVPVTLRSQDKVVATTMTATDGRFTVQGVRGGVHQVVAGEGHGIYRLWTPGTAPPSAQVNAVVYTETVAVAQSSPNIPVTYTAAGGVKGFLTNPWVIGGVVATAIAVPVALNNTHHSSSP